VKTDAAKAAGRAATCAALIAACATLWLILRYGVDVPFWDQWQIAPFFDKLASGTLTLSDLFAQQNEYRQFFPNLLFVALGRLTRWNVKYEMLASLLLACLVCWNVRRLGARTSSDPFRGAVCFVLASLLVFSPMQFENWLFGVQVVYFVPAACITTGLVVAYSERLSALSALVACACLSAVSTFSSANGVLCWLVLAPALLVARTRLSVSARHWLPLWTAGLALCVAVYAYGYHGPASHPSTSEALRHPFDGLAYFVALLGGPLAVGRRQLAAALVVGACALAAYACACAYLLKWRADRALLRRAAPWVLLGAYSLGTAAMVTAGRLGFGVVQSLSSRYTTFSLYLLVGLVYLLPCILEDAAREPSRVARHAPLLKRLAASVAVLLALAHVIAFVLVVRHGATTERRGLLRAKTCLLFIDAVPEERCLAEGLYPYVGVLRERAEALDRIGYLRPPLVRTGNMRELTASGAGCSDDYGSFDILDAEGGEYVAAGRALLPRRRGGEPADAVVLAYGTNEDEQTAFALAEVGVEKQSTSGSIDEAHWRKTFSTAALRAATQVGLTAWAFDAEEGKAYRLCGTRALPQLK
jgi:hypothetical protein